MLSTPTKLGKQKKLIVYIQTYHSPHFRICKHHMLSYHIKHQHPSPSFVPQTGSKPVGMGLPRAAWVKLNRLRTGVGRFHSSMHKWGLAPSPNCECGASEQTADHVLTACPIHRAPHGARGLTVLDNETRCWLNDITASV